MVARLLEPKYSQLSETKKANYLPKPYKIRRYYTPEEVSLHNISSDCWVSFFDGVYDLTQIIHKNYSQYTELLIKAAGTDISHWFDPKTKEVIKENIKILQPKTWINPQTNILDYYCPQGTFLHITPGYPCSDFDINIGLQWWKDSSLRIGTLTCKVRKIRIINMLSKHDDIINVCTEETINEILDRYLELNEHAASYTWKRLGRPLDMDKTLDQNDIPDETEEFLSLNIDEDEYIPAIHLYYNDDLTVA